MATLQRPALRRTAATQPIRASFFDDSNDARNSPQAQQLREQITTVYSNTPFRGPAFQLPSGAVVVEDMWLASLNTTIDEILDSGLDGLKVFADQTNPRGWVLGWLGHKVRLEGTDEQKQWYEALIRTFDSQPGPTPIVPEPWVVEEDEAGELSFWNAFYVEDGKQVGKRQVEVPTVLPPCDWPCVARRGANGAWEYVNVDEPRDVRRN